MFVIVTDNNIIIIIFVIKVVFSGDSNSLLYSRFNINIMPFPLKNEKRNFFVVLLCLRFLHDYLFPFSIRYYNQIFECVYDFKWYPFDTQVRKTRSQLFSDKGRNHEDKYLPLWNSSVLQHCPPSREESERVCSTNPISIWVLRTDGPYSSNLSPIMLKVCKR